jgi:hypothetical protein
MRAMIPSGEKTWISVRVAVSRLLDVGDRVRRQAVELASSLHDAVEDRDGLLARAVRHLAVQVDPVGGPALDAIGRQVLKVDGAEVREDVVAEDRVVVAERGGLPLAVLLDVAEVFVAGVADRGSGADHAGERSGGGFDGRLAEPGLGRALGEVASRRAAAVGPGRRLPPKGKAWPDGAVMAGVARSRRKVPRQREARDTFGTRPMAVEPSRATESADLQHFPKRPRQDSNLRPAD